MAKKKGQARRLPRTTEPRMFGDGKPSQASQQGERAAATPARSASGTQRAAVPAGRSVPVSTMQDYSYVLKDLRHLGILAASVFAVLIVLGLIIR